MEEQAVILTRRQALRAGAMSAAALAAPAILTGTAAAQTVDVAELMKPGPLGEMALGPENSAVTLVEYASMTCGHCANFHRDTYAKVKEAYIETDKIRFVFREFPLDPLAAAAFMLARCAPEDKYFDVIDVMFAQQRRWAFTDNPLQSLQDFARQIGFTQKSFEACLTNQELLDGVNWVRNRASEKFGVNATPTFFLNGKKLSGGALGFDDMSRLLDAEL